MTPISLGVTCDLESASTDNRSASFSLVEFARVTDGQRLTLHTDRGWAQTRHTTGDRDEVEGLNMWTDGIVDDLVGTIRNVLLPDDIDPPDEHDWARLVGLFAACGVTTSRDELRRLPYLVEFTEAVLDKLPAEEAQRSPIAIDWLLDD